MTPAGRTRRARRAAEHRHMVRRLVERYEAAPLQTRYVGLRWYSRAEFTVAKLAAAHDFNVPAVAGIIAVLSPQQRWRKNVEYADAVMRGESWRAVGYGRNIDKAKRIRAGADPLDVVSGPKVSAFFANLIGSREAVSIDVWAALAALGKASDAPKAARYEQIARAYRAAAELSGIPPREFQSVIWQSIRPEGEHGRDVATIEEICR